MKVSKKLINAAGNNDNKLKCIHHKKEANIIKIRNILSFFDIKATIVNKSANNHIDCDTGLSKYIFKYLSIIL